MPQWCLNDIIRTNINIKTLYKIFVIFSDCIVKQKKGNLLKKNKKTFIMESGKTYKTDVFKIKGIKAVIRKRDNEVVIGDYKSDVRRKNLNSSVNPLLGSNGKINSFVKNSNDSVSISEASEGDISDNESDNDNDSVLSNDDNQSDLEKDEFNEAVQHDSIFKKYIKNDTIDVKTEKIITDIIIKGEDSEHNKVDAQDMLFLTTNYPDYIENLINKPISKKKYIEMLRHLNIEDKADLDGGEYQSTLSRRNKIKSSEDPNVAFYRIISGIPGEDDTKSTVDEVKDRLKNFNWENNKITEEDYFDPSNTENLHMGRLMTISESTKSNKYIKLWMTQKDEYPISFEHIEPIFQFINMIIYDNVTEENDREGIIFGKKNEYLRSSFKDKRFPVKIGKIINIYIIFLMKT